MSQPFEKQMETLNLLVKLDECNKNYLGHVTKRSKFDDNQQI